MGPMVQEGPMCTMWLEERQGREPTDPKKTAAPLREAAAAWDAEDWVRRSGPFLPISEQPKPG